MTKTIKKLIAVILTLIMAISAMPLTALATTTDSITYDGVAWTDDDYNKITDGYAVLAPKKKVFVYAANVSVSNTFSDVEDKVATDNYINNTGKKKTTYYLLLNGTTITVTDVNPASYTATISAGENGTVSTSSISGVASGTAVTTSANTLTIGSTTVTATANEGYEFDSWSGVPSDGTITADTTITANFKATSYSKDITVSWKDGYSPKAGDTVATLKSNLVCSDTDNLTYEIGVYSVETDDDLADTDVLAGGKAYGIYCYVNLNDDSSKFATTSPIGNKNVYYTGTINILDVTYAANSCLVGDNNGEFSINSLANTSNNVNSKNNKIQAFDCVTYPEFTIPASVDKTALASAITLGKTYTSKDYYQSLANLSFKIENGQDVYDDEEATQDEVDSAVAGIQSAINALQLKEYDVYIYKNGEDTAVGAVQYGETFTVDADLKDGESVYKWVKSTDAGDTLLATNSNSVSVVVTSNMSLCYYTETAPAKEATTALVKYVDKSEKVVATDYVTIGDSYTPNDDNAPTLAFYSFAGWDVVQGNLTSATKVGIVLKAKYTASKTEANKVTIIGLDGVTVQGETEYDAYYDEKVTLAGGTNYVFCKADGTEISSINDTYIYAPHLNETIYIKSVDTKSSNASTRITGSFTANNYFTINAQYYVPDGCTAVEAGVVVSKTNTDPTIGADGCTKLVSNSQGDNHEYSISIKCSSTGTLNTKSYLIYKDASGNLNTVYSDASALSYGA